LKKGRFETCLFSFLFSGGLWWWSVVVVCGGGLWWSVVVVCGGLCLFQIACSINQKMIDCL
jgi:hypothetical protein